MKYSRVVFVWLFLLITLSNSGLLLAQNDTVVAPAAASITAPAQFDSGDTAWILTATALVLFMTIPGLSMFYAGLVRGRNVLSVFMHCFVITCVMSIVWVVCGYSLVFTDGAAVLGGMSKSMLRGVLPGGAHSLAPTIPEVLYFAYQMTFFIITPALIIGAFVERIRFSSMLMFVIAWSLLVYVPIAHIVWGGGNLFGLTGAKDFAGGIVVHITAGISALVACIMVGRRRGFPETPFVPHNLPMTVIGTGMLWVGWYGFNAGSAVAANSSAAMTLTVTHLSAASGALTWMFIEWILFRKPSVLGIATGSIAGLAAVTPASGFIGPMGGLLIGAISGLVCWCACARLKKRFGYDDSLDVFGVHGVGGFLGTILVAVFASKTFGGFDGGSYGADGANYSIGKQLGTQTAFALFTTAYSALATYLILKLTDKVFGLRVSDREESEGLDIADHGESAYN